MGSVLQSAVAVNSVQARTLLFRRILDSLIVISWCGSALCRIVAHV
jgi:hypothetical protein